MNKPCCCELCEKDGGMEEQILYCSNPSCKCHLPKEKCECACHENKLGKPYAHDTKCCEAMNGTVEPPAPEKKWEESLDDIMIDVCEDAKCPTPEEHRDLKMVVREHFKELVGYILEEKAVEVEKREAPIKLMQDGVSMDFSFREGWNALRAEAAAILRR